MTILLGPKISKWLSRDDEVDSWEEIDAAIQQRWKAMPKQALDQAADIVMELVQMRQGGTVLSLYAADPERPLWHSFQGLLLLGSASMIVEDIDAALDYFSRAQAANPHELAPYRNIAQLCAQKDDRQASRQWCEAGFDVEPNDHFLWEHYAWACEGDPTLELLPALKNASEKWNSWCGASLLAHLTDPDDGLLRAQALEGFYAKGQRDPEFLIEYTAALGAATQYDAIPSIVFEAESRSETTLPWQLYAHTAQAYLGKEEPKEAKAWLIKAKMHPELPPELRGQLDAMFEQIDPPSS